MTDDRDDLLSDLRTEFAGVVPSPAFAAAVRARVAETSTDRRWLPWRYVFVGAAAAVVLAAIGLTRVSERELAMAPAVPAAPATASAPSVAPPVESASPSVLPPRALVRSAAPRREAGAARVTATNDPFEIQVPPDQAVALRSLLVALRERRAVVPAPTAAWSLGPLPELEALTIPPLQLELLPGTPAAGGGRKTP
jgi:hypothetical protein